MTPNYFLIGSIIATNTLFKFWKPLITPTQTSDSLENNTVRSKWLTLMLECKKFTKYLS